MQGELGELCARWLYERYEKTTDHADPLEMEVGDLVNLIIAFCNTQDIDFENAVRQTIKKRRKQH
jgi:NTP pyrophosphatase (non-canonical NTP hydrolase)